MARPRSARRWKGAPPRADAMPDGVPAEHHAHLEDGHERAPKSTTQRISASASPSLVIAGCDTTLILKVGSRTRAPHGSLVVLRLVTKTSPGDPFTYISRPSPVADGSSRGPLSARSCVGADHAPSGAPSVRASTSALTPNPIRPQPTHTISTVAARTRTSYDPARHRRAVTRHQRRSVIRDRCGSNNYRGRLRWSTRFQGRQRCH
jgi:hypothetical protein